MISNWFIEAANFTSGAFEPGIDEVDVSGLTPMPSVRVGPIISYTPYNCTFSGLPMHLKAWTPSAAEVCVPQLKLLVRCDKHTLPDRSRPQG